MLTYEPQTQTDFTVYAAQNPQEFKQLIDGIEASIRLGFDLSKIVILPPQRKN